MKAAPTVIGEIGGSSSRWAFISSVGTVATFPLKGDTLTGFNPLNGDADLFAKEVSDYFKTHDPNYTEHMSIQIYGAGCGSEDRQSTMRDAIGKIWPNAERAVDTDLMGAAKGLYGTKPGLVLILGTGMNVGYYNEGMLHRPMPSLGFILGDEGSGADIGKHLLQDAFYDRMPIEIKGLMFGNEKPDLNNVLQQLHRGAFPAKALASYTGRVASAKDETYLRDVITSRFHALAELLVTYFTTEQRAEVAATGSVAYGFRHLLNECLLDRGITLTIVEPDPLGGLVRYHRPTRWS